MNAKEKERAEGWGWIAGSASSMLAWGILAAMHHNVNAGILVGSMCMGIWKVTVRGR